MQKQFKVNSNELLKILQPSMKIIKIKSPIPLYSCGKIEIKNNLLYLTVTDGDHTLINFINVFDVIGENFIFLIKINDLFEIVKKYKNNINIFVEENKIIILNEKSKVQLFLINEKFPSISLEENIVLFSIEIKEFLKIFVFLSITNEDWNFNLYVQNNQILCVCSDKKRLIHSFIMNNNILNIDRNFSISFKTLFLLIKDITGNITFAYRQKDMVISFENGILYSNLSNYVPINYLRIIEKKNNASLIILNKKLLLDALTRAMILASNISRIVKLKFQKNILIISSSDISRGQAEEEISIENEIEGYINLNCDFLINAIKYINNENIYIYYTGHISHFFVSNEENSITTVIMPIIIN